MFTYKIEYNLSGSWVEIPNVILPIRTKETLDESLDEAKILTFNNDRATPYEPFTKVCITITDSDNNTKREFYVVSYDNVKENRKFSSNRYNHDIELIEATKILERYTVDNITFTNKYNKLYNDGGAKVYYNTSNWEVINNYGNLDYTKMLGEMYSARELNCNNQNMVFSNGGYDKEYIKTSSVLIKNLIVSLPKNINIMYGMAQWTSEDIYYSLDTVRYRKANSTLWNDVDINTNITLSEEAAYVIQYSGYYYLTLRDSTITGTCELKRKFTINCLFNSVNNLSTQHLMTCADAVDRLFKIVPTRLLDNSSQKPQPPTFYLSDESRAVLELVNAPEFMFTNKNLFEVLKIIGGVCNGIPYLDIQDQEEEWGRVSYLFLSSREEQSTDVNTNYTSSTSSLDCEDYAASYDVYANNVINSENQTDNLCVEPSYHYGVSVRSDTIEISESNMMIPTQSPIYKIVALQYIRNDTGAITNIQNIVEEAVYKTLSDYPQTNGDTEWKGNYLYYKQGQKNIYGLTYKVSSNVYSAASNKIAIKNIIGASQWESNLTTPFIIQYIPFTNSKFRYYKTDAPARDMFGTMFNSQSANITDVDALGKNMNANINKTGNIFKTQQTIVKKLVEIPKIGTRTSDGYFVNTVDTEFNAYRCIINTTFVKDYQKISEFININSQQRYYQISEKMALDRYITTNMFYIFGMPTLKVDPTNALGGLVNHNYLWDLFHTTKYRIKCANTLRYSKGDMILTGSQLPLKTYITGNAISMIMDFDDNYGTGYQAIDYSGVTSDTNALCNKALRYSDEDGEIDAMLVVFGGDSFFDTSITWSSNLQEMYKNNAKTYPENVMNLGNNDFTPPSQIISVDEDTGPMGRQVGQQALWLYKDNREIIHLNMMYHFLTNDTNIVIGQALTSECKYFKNTNNTNYYRIVWLNRKIDTYEQKIPESAIIKSVLITNSNYSTYFGIDEDTGNISDAEHKVTPIIAPNNLAPVDCKAWGIMKHGSNEILIIRNEELKTTNTMTPIYCTLTSIF